MVALSVLLYLASVGSGLQNQDCEETGLLQFNSFSPCKKSTTIYSAGINTYGQLAVSSNSGTLAASPCPMEVTSLGKVADIAAGGFHSMFLMQDGTVYTAGYNRYGQLAVSTNAGTRRSNQVPLKVSSLGAKVAAIAASWDHSIFLMKDGAVYTAGDNFYGELGVSTDSPSPNPTPMQVKSLGTDVAAITGGDFHSIFLMKNGTVYTAGKNTYGQLAVDTNLNTSNSNPIPLQVKSLGTEVAAIAGGRSFSMFLMKNGSVYTAGYNGNGQLGVSTNSGTRIPNPIPMQVKSLGTEVAAVAGGFDHSMFLMQDGTVYAAGSNLHGQLAVSMNSGTSYPNPTPKEVTSLGAVAAIAPGNGFSTFLLKNGSVYSAGLNTYGQLAGDNNVGLKSSNHIPILVRYPSEFTKVDAIAAGSSFSMFQR